MHPFEPDGHAQRILAAIADSSDDAIIGKDLSGTIITWNRGAQNIYGYTAAEMIGRTVAVLIPPERDGELDSLMQAVGRGERVVAHDTIRLTKSGHRIEVSLTITPIRDGEDRLVGAATVARDITTQRRAERELRSSEARWRAIIDSAVDGIIVIDARGRIESFNTAAERLFGYSSAEVIGRNVSVLMPVPYKDEHDHYLKRYAMTGARHIIGIGRNVSGRRKDGTTFPIHLSVGEMMLDGVRKFTGIVHDLTQQSMLEAKLRDEAGLARIGEMAAVLAHEVRNPLAAVSGAIQVLGDKLPDDQPIVGEILKRLDGLNRLMSDLLLYARPPRPQLVDVDLTGLLNLVVDLLATDPAWQNIVVTVEGSAPRVKADIELMKIAFQNLLVNAAQASASSARIRAALTSLDDNMVAIDIVDRGAGIPLEVQARLFTPFFTTKSRGTGLGLATVKRIAESHGGTASILSTGADGTTMRITLPASSVEPVLA